MDQFLNQTMDTLRRTWNWFQALSLPLKMSLFVVMVATMAICFSPSPSPSTSKVDSKPSVSSNSRPTIQNHGFKRLVRIPISESASAKQISFLVDTIKFGDEYPQQHVSTQERLVGEGLALLDPTKQPLFPTIFKVMVPPSPIVPYSFASCFMRNFAAKLNRAFDYTGGPVFEYDMNGLTSKSAFHGMRADWSQYLTNGGRVIIFHHLEALVGNPYAKGLSDNIEIIDNRLMYYYMEQVDEDTFANASTPDGKRWANGTAFVVDFHFVSGGKLDGIMRNPTIYLQPGDVCVEEKGLG